jgi:hypothetical protein
MGVCASKRRIVPKSKLQTGKTLGSAQDGSRQWTSLLACICADGSVLPPALIYQAESGDLMDTWLDDFDDSREQAYFTSSKKGWTNDELGLAWLKQVFDPRTKQKAGRLYRLLLMDGHGSHLNLKFIDYCDSNRIILGIFPPHSTHRLQPLDVGIFSPLATAYSNELDRLIQSSYGFCSLSKRNFWKMFNPAWKQALTYENIRSAFSSTGIYPLNGEKLINLVKKTPSPTSSDSEARKKTPGSVRAVRRRQKAAAAAGVSNAEALAVMSKAALKLATQVEILNHEVAGLKTALVGEKQRRRRGKNMGLLAPDQPGQTQFFSPARIRVVRTQQQDLETQKSQNEQDKEVKRLEKQAEKDRKAREAEERRKSRAAERAEKQAQKQAELETRRAQKAVNKQLKAEEQLHKPTKQAPMKRTKRKLSNSEPVELPDPKTRVARSGRSVALPTRFRQ